MTDEHRASRNHPSSRTTAPESRANGPWPAHVVVVALTLANVAIAGVVTVGCEAPQHERVAVTREECVTCHITEFERATEPLHVGNFPETCGDCHREYSWRPAERFDHQQFFAIEGAHALVKCSQCHTRGYAAGQTPKDCVGCHRQDYAESPFPRHSTFPTTCADCHSTSGWKSGGGASARP